MKNALSGSMTKFTSLKMLGSIKVFDILSPLNKTFIDGIAQSIALMTEKKDINFIFKFLSKKFAKMLLKNRSKTPLKKLFIRFHQLYKLNVINVQIIAMTCDITVLNLTKAHVKVDFYTVLC